jgi:hypothetical protein
MWTEVLMVIGGLFVERLPSGARALLVEAGMRGLSSRAAAYLSRAQGSSKFV